MPMTLGFRVLTRLALLSVLATGLASPLHAQSGATAPASSSTDDDDAVLDPAEPEFRIVALPTTARLPRWKSNFSLTHRFAGNLRRNSFWHQSGEPVRHR